MPEREKTLTAHAHAPAAWILQLAFVIPVLVNQAVMSTVFAGRMTSSATRGGLEATESDGSGQEKDNNRAPDRPWSTDNIKTRCGWTRVEVTGTKEGEQLCDPESRRRPGRRLAQDVPCVSQMGTATARGT